MSQETFSPQILRDREDEKGIADRVLQWWYRLAGQKDDGLAAYPSGVRAVLRRAQSPDDALLSAGFRNLWLDLPSRRRTPWDMRAWGAVATVLAEVRHHVPDRTFAAAMATEKENGGGPRVSELRFQQLLRSNDLDELTRRARRAVHLIDEAVDVRSLADDLLLWHREKNGRYASRPDHRLAVRWADAYYTRLERNPKAADAG